eukprot:Awhi_evm1s775
MNVEFSGNYEVSGYYFPATQGSNCIYYIQSHEELGVSVSSIAGGDWPRGNMVGNHVLCQFVQKAQGRSEEMSQKDAQDFCEKQMAPFFKQSSYGKYNIRCETRIVAFPYSFEEFEIKTNNFGLSSIEKEFEKFIPSVFQDHKSQCDNQMFLIHKAPRHVGWAGVGFVGWPTYAINGKTDMRHVVVFHEYGHNLGLRHASDIERNSRDRSNINTMPTNFNQIVTYGDRHSMMGNNIGFGATIDFAARTKYFNNWLPASANRKVEGGATVTLQASDPVGGTQPTGIVTATYPFGTGSHTYNSAAPVNEQIEYMFEYRSQFSAQQVRGTEKGCVTVRLVRSMDQVKEANFRINPTGKTFRHCAGRIDNVNCALVSGMQIPASEGNCLVEGSTYTDAGSGLTLNVISIDSNTATIEINGGEIPTSNRQYSTYQVSSRRTSRIPYTYSATVRHYRGSFCGGYASSPIGRYPLGGVSDLETFDNAMNFQKWMEDPDYLRMLHRCYKDFNCGGVNFGKDGFTYRRSKVVMESPDPYEWCEIITDISIA